MVFLYNIIVKKLNQEEINKIISLRERGKTLTEIIKVLNRGKGTIYKYIKDVKIKKEYKEDFLDKKFASKMKSRKEWESARFGLAGEARQGEDG
jgi:IS30 family transposase